MRRGIIAIIVLVLIGLIVFRWMQNRAAARRQAAQRAAQLRAPVVVSVAPVRVQDIVSTFASVGSVDPPLNVRLSPNVSGRITYLQVHEGDRIARGQVLVRIDPSEVEAEVRQARGALIEAQHRLAQAQVTQVATNTQVLSQLQQQRAAVASAQADLNQATRNYQTQVAAADAAVRNAEATVRTARANLDLANKTYQRDLELYNKGFLAAQEADTAQAAARVAQSTLDADTEQWHSARQQAQTTRATASAAIADNRAKLDQAGQALRFAQANLTQQPAYRENLAALQAAVAQARDTVRAAEARRSYTVLTAPLDGFVTGRLQDPGSEATPGQPVLVLQYMRQIWVAVTVPEDVSRQIVPGHTAQITLAALPGRTFVGRIVQFNPSADVTSRQFTVRIALNNPGVAILPGMFAHVVIVTGRVPHAVVVPREAVQHDARGDYVMVVDHAGVAHRQTVTLGLAGVAVIAIKSGVSPGERVVTLSASPLKDGQRVRVAGGRPAAPAGARVY